MAMGGTFAGTRAGWAAGPALLTISPREPGNSPYAGFHCRLSRRGGLTAIWQMHREKNSFFYRNEAGMCMKTKDRCGKSGNEAGMFVKIKLVILPKPEYM